MSVSTVSQSLSAVSNGITQPTISFSGHLYALFQYRRVAVPALAISTVAGAALGIFVMSLSLALIDKVAERGFGRQVLFNSFYKITQGTLSIAAGVLTFAGVNIGVSKLLHLPFSRRASIGISVATIVLPLLLVVGFVAIQDFIEKKRIQARNIARAARMSLSKD